MFLAMEKKQNNTNDLGGNFMKIKLLTMSMITILMFSICGCQKNQTTLETKTTENNESKDNTTFTLESYGFTTEIREVVIDKKSKELLFYYEMTNFFVNDTFSHADAINATLQEIYDGYETIYKEEALEYQNEEPMGSPNTPYQAWYLQELTFVGDDYISILYNDISHMGGARAYSYFDAITIDCKTGKEVSASELLEVDDETILEKVSQEMGLDEIADWDDIDYYLTASDIVFFYRMPNYWEDVVWKR